MWQALLISIWQLSAILLLISSPLKLCQVGWGQTHIFRFLQKYLIGFKRWLGHSRTFTELSISHSCCVFRSIVLLEGKPSASLRFWMLWTGFSLSYLNILVLWAFLLLWRVPQSLPLKNSPTAWDCYQHTLLLGWYSACDEQCLVSFKQDAWNWGSSDQRILFLTVWGSFRYFFANSKCVFMCLHWREDWVLPHCHKAQIDGVLQWCLSFCRFHLSAYMIMELN